MPKANCRAALPRLPLQLDQFCAAVPAEGSSVKILSNADTNPVLASCRDSGCRRWRIGDFAVLAGAGQYLSLRSAIAGALSVFPMFPGRKVEFRQFRPIGSGARCGHDWRMGLTNTWKRRDRTAASAYVALLITNDYSGGFGGNAIVTAVRIRIGS